MQGDFSRGFNPDRKRGKDYRRVLLQQGSVLLDSDFNTSIDTQDQLIRELANDLGCEVGSPDLGYLVTPGRLLACFDLMANIEPTTTGSLEFIRDYSQKYLDRYPSLRVSAPSGGTGGTITIPFLTALSGSVQIALWVRAASNTLVTITGAGGNTTVPGQDEFSRTLVQLTDASAMQIALNAGEEIWIALIETHLAASLVPQFGLMQGHYYLQGMSVPTVGGTWPAASFDPTLGFTAVDLVIPVSGGTRTLQGGDRLVVYLEGWERHITGIEDSGTIEQALGSNRETCTRTLASGQVKVAPALGFSPVQVRAAFQTRRLSDGTLTINTTPVVDDPDPCALPVTGGYTGRDHRLYRFEVHRGGTFADTIVKWSRDNASDLVALQALNTAQLEVPAGSPLNDGDLVEILSETIDLGDTSLATLVPATGEFVAPTRAVGELVRLRDEGVVSSGTRHRFSFRDRNDESIPVTLSDLQRYGIPNPIPDPLPPALKLKVRRWQGTIEPTGGIAPFTAQLENGISLVLNGTFEAGDWWQYEARAGRDNANGPWQATPHGPERLFAPLALLEFQDATQPLRLLAWLDERFPSLCSIDADDIAFDGDRINSTSTTVQEALEELWFQVQSCGEIIARPTDNLQTIFNAIPDGESARVCLHPGIWDLNATITVTNKGDLVVSGAGFGTQLRSSVLDPVLAFSGCRSVTVRDLTVNGGSARTVGDGLRGAISLIDCESVNLEHLQVRCGASTSRRMSAIQVWTESAGRRPTDIHIARCRVQVGHGQTGILIVNAGRAEVVDNEIETPAEDLILEDKVTDPMIAAAIGRVFMDQIRIGENEETQLFDVLSSIGIGTRNRAFSLVTSTNRRRVVARFEAWGNEFITFSTHRALLLNAVDIADDAIRVLDVRTWRDIFLANPIGLTGSTRQAREGILRTKLRQLRSGLALNLFGSSSTVAIPQAQQGFFNLIETEISQLNAVAAGNQGIVIGGDRTPQFGASESRESAGDGLFINRGDRAPDVWIANNRIIGFVQGIHIGTSRQDGDRHLRSYNAQVVNNTIQLRLPSLAQERHGIFVGHAHTVQIQNNLIEVISPSSREWDSLPPTDGIRLFGVYGPRLQVRQNHCIGVNTGIRVQARNAGKQETHHNIRLAWIVADNAYAGFGTDQVLNAEPLNHF